MEENAIAHELVETFRLWMQRSDRRRETNLNTLKSSYNRVKISVKSLLREAQVEAGEGESIAESPLAISETSTTVKAFNISSHAQQGELEFLLMQENSVKLHRAIEESRHWRREADRLQGDLCKLRNSCKILLSQSKVTDLGETQALRASAAQWKSKCADLQAALAAQKKFNRVSKYEEAFSEHAEARRNALQEEVQRLRTRLEAACAEIQRLRPCAARCGTAEKRVQELEDELTPIRSTLEKVKCERNEALASLENLRHEQDVKKWTASSEMEQALIEAEMRGG